jgi:hypothetical protein
VHGQVAGKFLVAGYPVFACKGYGSLLERVDGDAEVEFAGDAEFPAGFMKEDVTATGGGGDAMEFGCTGCGLYLFQGLTDGDPRSR